MTPQEQNAATVAATAAATASAAAIALAKTSADTAAALAASKAQSDTAITLMGADINYIKKDIAEIKDVMKTQAIEYITRQEFAPVRNVAYGLVSVFVLTTIGAILRLVLKV